MTIVFLATLTIIINITNMYTSVGVFLENNNNNNNNNNIGGFHAKV